MTFCGAILTGQFSRSVETIKTHRLLRDGYAMKEDFAKAVHRDAKEIIVSQKDGYAFVSGGQIDWLDVLRPIASSFSGFERRASSREDAIGPVTRWFRTNTFYRKPHIKGKLSCNGDELANYLPKLDKNGAVFLPGPYTFWRLVENSHYKEGEDIMYDYAAAVSANIPKLKKQGYECILFLEPSVGYDFSLNSFEKPSMIATFFDSLDKRGFKVGIHFPLCDASKVIPSLDCKADFYGIDGIYSNFKRLETDKDVILGIVDGSRVGIETEDYIIQHAKRFLEESGFSGDYFIGPNDRLFDVRIDIGIKKI